MLPGIAFLIIPKKKHEKISGYHYFFGSFSYSFGQDTTGVQTTAGVQVVLLKPTFYHELPLYNSLALRSELGWYSPTLSAIFDGEKYRFAFAPMMILETRFYLKLQKRREKGRNTLGNAADFFGLRFGLSWIGFP